MKDYIHEFLLLKAEERKLFLCSSLYYFCLLTAYFLLKPLRDEMGILGGVENLPWMFTATFGAMCLTVPVFGLMVKNWARKKLLTIIYCFFGLNLLIFYFLFTARVAVEHVAFLFFIWTSVFNLFAVSIFWSFMGDLFSPEQSRRLFGGIAAGGSLGALVGPLMASYLANAIGPFQLLPLASILLLFSVLCVHGLLRMKNRSSDPLQCSLPIGGNIWQGLLDVWKSPYLRAVVSFVLLYSFLHTLLYLEQAAYISASISSSRERTVLFARIDLWVNVLSLGVQFFLTGRIFKYLGIAFSLALIPLLVSIGLINISLFNNLTLVILTLGLIRAGNFSILRPGKENLFTVLIDEQRYKAKNFIDTTVFRGGDVLSSWIYFAAQSMGLSLIGISIMAVPVALLWSLNGFKLGQGYQNRWLSGRI